MSLSAQEIRSNAPPIVPGRTGAGLVPRDRVTLSAGARDAPRDASPTPQSDVRWYHPRGDAGSQRARLVGWVAQGAVPSSPPCHAAVASYLRAMQQAE